MERPSTICEWRYLPRGAVAHAVGRYDGEIQASAVCGVGPWTAAYWHGTGDQREYERLASLPTCHNCLRMINRRVAAA